MNTKEFKGMIKQLIKEELKESLPQILEEYFDKNQSNPAIVESKRELSEIKKQKLSELFNRTSLPPTQKQEQRPTKTYVKDPALNAILNETAPRNMDSPYGPMVSTTSPIASTVGADSPIQREVIEENAVPDGIFSTLNQNFTEKLKLIDQKVKQRHGI